MKQCPQCNQAYGDDSLRYCLADGAPLVQVYSATEQPTVVLPSPGPAPITNKVVVGGVHPLFKYLAVGLAALLLLFAGGGLALFLMWQSNNAPAANNAERVAIPAQSATPAATSSRTPAEKPVKTPVSSPTLSEPKTPATPKPPQPAADPGVTRIAFRKGRVGETVSGNLNRKREFVLRTLAGQSLSASIRSANGCAVFDNGSSNTSFTTSSGDTYLRVENSCGDATRFSLTVTVR
jgi:hypothetical protein